MRKTVLFLVVLLLALSAFLPTGAVHAKGYSQGEVVVANRASGTISVIDVRTEHVTTVNLPAGDNPPEPMYVVYVHRGNYVFVGDRANDRVVVFDADDYSVVDTIPAGANLIALKHTGGDPIDLTQYDVKAGVDGGAMLTLTINDAYMTNVSVDKSSFKAGETAQYKYTGGPLNANQQYTVQIINKITNQVTEKKVFVY